MKTFKIHNVELSNKHLPKKDIKSNFFISGKIQLGEMVEKNDFLYKNLSYKGDIIDYQSDNGRVNNFLLAVDAAFTNHLPLIISPDMIWQNILNGVGQHINKFKYEYAKTFGDLNPDRKKELIVTDFSVGSDDDIFNRMWYSSDAFVSKIKANISTKFHDIFFTKFSTTTGESFIASSIATMDTFSPFFTYTMVIGCGFPEIRVSGELEDWVKIKQNIKVLKKLLYIDKNINVDFWFKPLNKLVSEFYNVINDNINLKFWNSLYKIDSTNQLYGQHNYISGYIFSLFPYLSNGLINPLLKKPLGQGKHKEFIDGVEIYNILNNIEINSFSYGVSFVDVKFIYNDSKENELGKFIGGFLGVKQNEDSSLEPILGYGLLK